ncbi:3'(2'),5'-bisphosphate nucleotidase [Candidatus Poribacteria bacterium]|nr:MAG: 3'(2'),5'-bisphosphate nucleotidase [Candidatus Poribacteria bacterium]
MITRKQIAIDAVIKATELCQTVQSEMVSTDTIQKKDRSPVTIADFGSQAIICKVIGDTFPEDIVVGEEDANSLRSNSELLDRVVDNVKTTITVNANITGSHLGDDSDTIKHEQVCEWIDRGSGDIGESYWTLDPIDGTKGFLRKDQYAIALAWIDEGIVKLGVLSCPNLPHQLNGSSSDKGSLFVAVKGEGTSLHTLEGDFVKKIDISDSVPCLAESFESTHGDTDTHAKIANKLGLNAPPVQIDSQAKYGIVARGEASLYIRLPNPASPDYRECIWDHAAGMLVVEEAGGIVTDAHGMALSYLTGRRMTNNHGIIATTKSLHPIVLTILSEISL